MLIEKRTVSSLSQLEVERNRYKSNGFTVLQNDDPASYTVGILPFKKDDKVEDGEQYAEINYHMLGPNIKLEYHELTNEEELLNFYNKNHENQLLVSCDLPKQLKLGWAVYDKDTNTSNVYLMRLSLCKKIVSTSTDDIKGFILKKFGKIEGKV